MRAIDRARYELAFFEADNPALAGTDVFRLIKEADYDDIENTEDEDVDYLGIRYPDDD